MAFWIGEFVGGFVAAIFVPLFLFYVADRKGRSSRAATILRFIAVIVAVFAACAAAAGGGGRFPAGAVAAVFACFVWALRSTIRERGTRLNGWQRIGVILSVLWVPVGFLLGNSWWIESNGSGWINLYQACIEMPDATRTSLAECQRQFDKNYVSAIAGHWWAALATAVVPLLLAWGLAWVCMRLFRWVRAGFVRQQA